MSAGLGFCFLLWASGGPRVAETIKAGSRSHT